MSTQFDLEQQIMQTSTATVSATCAHPSGAVWPEGDGWECADCGATVSADVSHSGQTKPVLSAMDDSANAVSATVRSRNENKDEK